VTVSPKDAAVKVDGRPLESVPTVEELPLFVVGERDATPRSLPSSTFDVWVDPGAHVFVATGEGEVRVVESRTFAAGEQVELRLEVPSALPPSPPPEPSRTEPNSAPVLPVDPAASRVPVYVAFGVGGVGLVGGAVFASLALAEKRSLDAEPTCVQRRCPRSYAGQQERMVLFADVATVGLVTGLVGATVGTLLYFTAKPRQPTTGITLAPFLADDRAGLRGTF
jgi:hypothetical protein